MCVFLFPPTGGCGAAVDGPGHSGRQQKVVGVHRLFPGRQRSRPDRQEQEGSDAARPLSRSQSLPRPHQVLRRKVHVTQPLLPFVSLFLLFLMCEPFCVDRVHRSRTNRTVVFAGRRKLLGLYCVVIFFFEKKIANSVVVVRLECPVHVCVCCCYFYRFTRGLLRC